MIGYADYCALLDEVRQRSRDVQRRITRQHRLAAIARQSPAISPLVKHERATVDRDNEWATLVSADMEPAILRRDLENFSNLTAGVEAPAATRHFQSTRGLSEPRDASRCRAK